MVLSFSALINVKKFYQRNLLSERSSVSCLHGIRSITVIWVLIAHTFYLLPRIVENIDEFRHDISDKVSNLWIANCFLAVDVFFVLAGTVNAFGWFNKTRKFAVKLTWTSVGYWLRFYIHRAFRIWPLYIHGTLTAIYVKRFHYHPIMPEEDPITQCSKYWWHHMLFLNSFFGATCVPHTWYISTEFTFFLLSPIFLLTLQKSKTYGLLLSIVTIGLSSSLRVYAMIAYNMSPTLLQWSTPPIFNTNTNQHFAELYIKPQYRIGPYIIGLLLGYLLTTNDRPVMTSSKRLQYIGWITAIICGSVSFFGLYPILQGWKWPLYYLVYGALHRTIFALCVAWLIYACYNGYAGAINRFLSHKLFYAMATLSYALYMSHLPPVFGEILELPTPFRYKGVTQVLLLSVKPFLVSFTFSIIAIFICEYPVSNIQEILEKRFYTKNEKEEKHYPSEPLVDTHSTEILPQDEVSKNLHSETDLNGSCKCGDPIALGYNLCVRHRTFVQHHAYKDSCIPTSSVLVGMNKKHV